MLTARRTGDADYGRWIKVMIAGEPGVGKTLFGSTWPAVLYLNAEGGLMSVADRNVLTVDIESSQTLLEAIVALRQDPPVREKIFGGPVETVVLDTVDEVARLLQRERLNETKKETLAMQDWGWYGDQLRGILRGLRNLEMHVIFAVHVRSQEDSDSGAVTVKPAVQGQVGDELPGYVDLALLMRSSPVQKVVDGEIVRETARFLQTYGNSKYPWIKDRSGKLPSELDVNFVDDFKRIDSLVYGGREIDRTVTPTVVPDLPGPAAPVASPATPSPVTTIPEPAPKRTRSRKTTEPAEPELPAPPGVDPKTGEMEKSLIDSADDPHPPLPEAALAETPEPLVPEPAPEPEPEPEPAPEPQPAAKNKMGLPDDGPPWTCADCGEEFDDPDQAALSQIRFRRRLDGKCFRAAKSAKK
jgi:hypothetical protein